MSQVYYFYQNLGNNQILDTASNGPQGQLTTTRLQMPGTDSQKWRAGDKDRIDNKLQDGGKNLVIGVKDNNNVSDATLELQAQDFNNDNQKWQYNSAASTIMNEKSGLVIDASGDMITLQKSTNSEFQKWKQIYP